MQKRVKEHYLVKGGGPPVLLFFLSTPQIQRFVPDVHHPGLQRLCIVKSTIEKGTLLIEIFSK